MITSAINTTNFEAELSNNDSPPIPVAESEKTLLFVTGTISTQGVNSVIASPGATKQLKIVAIQVQSESDSANTATIKFGTTAKWRVHLPTRGSGFVIPIPSGRTWSVGLNTALVIDLASAYDCNYNIAYYSE